MGREAGDMLLGCPRPPYLYPALADPLRDVLCNRTLLFPLPEVMALAVDRNGRPVPLDALRSAVEADLSVGSAVAPRFDPPRSEDIEAVLPVGYYSIRLLWSHTTGPNALTDAYEAHLNEVGNPWASLD